MRIAFSTRVLSCDPLSTASASVRASVTLVAASSAAAACAFTIGALQAHLSNVEGAVELVRAGMLPLARAAVPAATAYLLVKQVSYATRCIP